MPVDNFVTTEGISVEEAVKKALKLLHIAQEQAHVEIISEGKQGFLGLGNKPAKVKVSIKEEAVAELQLHDILAELDIKDEAAEENYIPRLVNREYGTVEVKDGKIVVKNPVRPKMKYGTIRPGKHITLLVNGKKVEEETYVSEKDSLEVQLNHDEPKSSFSLNVSEDKVEAYVRYIMRPGARYRLKDQEPTNNLILLTEVEELIEPEPVQIEDLKKFLKENNIVKGIYEEALGQVLKNPNCSEAFLVAQGQKPIDGKSALIEYPYLTDDQNNHEEGELFGRTKLVSVNKGEVVAVKIPMEEGVDGWTVTGDLLKAQTPSDIELFAKKGCEVIEEGHKAVATVAGRPVAEVAGNKVCVGVDPIYEVKDVDNSVGNIKFSGDVEVRGDVKEGFTVEAEGNVEVFGNVTRATIKAGASVRVHKMILGSTVTAGGLAALYSTLIPMLKEIGDLIEKTYAVAQQLKGAAGFKTSDLQTKGDGQLIQLLMDSKFQSLPKLIGDFASKVVNSHQPVNEELLRVTDLLQKSLCGLGPLHLEKVEHLQILVKAVEQIRSYISGYMLKLDSITARYVQNSTLFSSGDVIIDGQGCYISTVTAGGEVVVTGNPGIARGVKITAHRNVKIKELGSEFDTQTSVIIKGNGKISAELVHPNVILQVGNERFRVDRASRSMDAYINHEGRLIIDKLIAEERQN